MLKVTKQSQQSFKWQHNRLSMAAVILTQRLIMKSTLHLRSDDNDPFIIDILNSSLQDRGSLYWFS